MDNRNAILFHAQDVDLPALDEMRVGNWLAGIVAEEGFRLEALNYIFCSDDYLHGINVQYLNHDTLTDIITFDNADEEGVVEGDIFISTERVRENAADFGAAYGEELLRVMAHGVLHLLGHKDKSEAEQAAMRALEDRAVQAFGPPPVLD